LPSNPTQTAGSIIQMEAPCFGFPKTVGMGYLRLPSLPFPPLGAIESFVSTLAGVVLGSHGLISRRQTINQL
ncbi:hypothetical protein FRC17_010547, partial [Serendipita sp. 399]